MNQEKIGGLICQLRQERGLTQQQLADRLGISNKTVSKWENGKGCPDLALWDDLSRLLGADVSGMLRGELTANRPDVGNLKRTKFYVCPVCGNILTATGPAELSCCGRRLYPMVPAEAGEEHAVKMEESDLEYYVTLDHPMERGHYIRFAALVQDDRVYLQRLYPEQDAAFRLPTQKRYGTLYVCCSQHGLMAYRL